MVGSKFVRRVVGAVLAIAVVTVGLAAGPAAAGSPTIDGQFSETGPIAGGSSFVLQVTGRGGVPATGVGAVALNVTITNPTAPSFLTVYPTGAPRPTAANLVFGTGQTVPNMVVVKIGDGGQVSLFNYGGTADVIVDVLGWFLTGASFTGVTPARLMDTRVGYPTIDSQFAGTGPVASTANLTVVGRGGVPLAGVGAVALNVTVVNPTLASFLTVWPAGAPKPTAANLNYVAGQSVPNMVMAKVGDGGQVSLFNYAGTADLVVDVLGWFPQSGSFTGITPARLMDTRAGYPTIDTQFAAIGQVGAGVVSNLTVVGRGGVPATGVGAVALNVTVTNPSASSFLTVYPTGAARPTAANLNYVPGQTVPNMVIVKVGDGGQISLFNYAGGTDLIVDVLGWFPTGQAYTGLTPARLMDSRFPPPAPLATIGTVRSQIVARPAFNQKGGLDRFAVWVCDVPVNSTSPDYAGRPDRLPIDPATVAAWATANVSPYFQRVSGGRYRTSFEGIGHIQLSATDGTSECLSKAQAASAKPYTNVFAADNSTRGDGYGGVGYVYTSDANNVDVFSVPPSQSHRGFWVGGLSVDTASGTGFPSVGVVAHEIGHTINWPHSFSGQTGSEYDNPLDLMSDITIHMCERDDPDGSVSVWACDAQNTLAFNRFAAGWIEDGQVQLQTGGTNTATLDAPLGSGTQFVAAPDSRDPHVMLTIEARPKIGLDQYLATEGVALDIVDQRGGACPDSFYYGNLCIGASRRQQQVPYADGNPYAHVIPVGGTATVDGVTVTVTGRIGNAFTVQVSGQFSAPAPAPNAFAAFVTDAPDEPDPAVGTLVFVP